MTTPHLQVQLFGYLQITAAARISWHLPICWEFQVFLRQRQAHYRLPVRQPLRIIKQPCDPSHTTIQTAVSPSVLSRTVTFIVNDGALNSNIPTRNISVSIVNDAPVLAAMEGTVLNFNEGGATAIVVTSLTTVSDVDNINLSGATIQITANYVPTEDVLTFTNASGITGVYDATTGTMQLSGSASVGNYQNAIRAVRYINTNANNPSASHQDRKL